MLLLPTNVIINILDNLDHEGLMKVYNLGNYYQNIIKHNIWKNITIRLIKKKRIEKFIDSGFINCFVKYDLSYSEITHELLKHFNHCQELILVGTKLE